MSINKYSVSIGSYAQSHYIKSFSKTYKTQWDYTLNTIIMMLEHLDNFLWDSKIELISRSEDTRFSIYKWEFSILKSWISPHASWNRYILFVDRETRLCKILLVYNKTDLPKNQHETFWRKSTIKSEYVEIQTIFPNL